jgi:hypothetical protein
MWIATFPPLLGAPDPTLFRPISAEPIADPDLRVVTDEILRRFAHHDQRQKGPRDLRANLGRLLEGDPHLLDGDTISMTGHLTGKALFTIHRGSGVTCSKS